MLAIKTDVTHTVTHQTTHILPPAGTQNALDESHKKATTQQAARSITLLARCRRAHGARLGRWRSQKHRWWPSAGVSGGGRDLTIRADDPTSRNNPTRANNPTQPKKHDSEVGPSRSTSLYNGGASSRAGCRALQLYSAPERSTALQLYSALHSTSSTPSLRRGNSLQRIRRRGGDSIPRGRK